MLTAMTDEPARAGFEAGVTDYVTKPFDPSAHRTGPRLPRQNPAPLIKTG